MRPGCTIEVMEPSTWESLRSEMVATQLEARNIRDPRVLDAMRTVPRHMFVPETARSLSYEDRALAVGAGQTISQPFMVGTMLEALGLTGSEKVLEIGTGTGYQAALLSLLAQEVHSVERIPELAKQARENLTSLGIQNVQIHVADGSQGLVQLRLKADRRSVTAATLIEKLSDERVPAMATVAGDDLYYAITDPADGSSGPLNVRVRRINLRQAEK